jgi:putative ABC transport system substrate-binding protein
VEGKNIIIEWRPSVGTNEEMATLAADLAKWKVDLIVVSSTPVARAALRLTTIPVIFAPVSDPVGTGLVASLGRPGGNATGISLPLTDLTAKRFEILRLLAPGARRIGCLANSSRRISPGRRLRRQGTQGR